MKKQSQEAAVNTRAAAKPAIQCGIELRTRVNAGLLLNNHNQTVYPKRQS